MESNNRDQIEEDYPYLFAGDHEFFLMSLPKKGLDVKKTKLWLVLDEF